MALDNRILEVRTPGGNWQVANFFAGNKARAIMSAPSGGGSTIEDVFAFDYATNSFVSVEQFKSGTPNPFTYNIELPYDIATAFGELPYGVIDVRCRLFASDFSDPTDFERLLVLPRSRKGDISFGGNIIDNSANAAAPNRTFAMQASALVEIKNVTHSRISAAASGEAANCIISLGIPNEDENDDGNQEFLVGTDDEATPATPKLLYTDDGGTTWTEISCTGLINNNIVGLAKAGANIVLATTGTASGIWYVPLSDIRAKPASVTPTAATGLTSNPDVNCIVAVSATELFAGGDAGAAWRSTDGGGSWTALTTGASNDFNSLAAYSADLVWFGGSSGEFYKYENGSFSAVTVTGLSTDTINWVAVPRRKRGTLTEVYLGTSGGDVIRSLDSGATWTTLSFDGSGSNSIESIAFSGPNDLVMWVVQTNGSSQSRLLRIVGDNMGTDTIIQGSYTSPANSVINAVVASDENTAMTVGELNAANVFVGKAAA